MTNQHDLITFSFCHGQFVLLFQLKKRWRVSVSCVSFDQLWSLATTSRWKIVAERNVRGANVCWVFLGVRRNDVGSVGVMKRIWHNLQYSRCVIVEQCIHAKLGSDSSCLDIYIRFWSGDMIISVAVQWFLVVRGRWSKWYDVLVPLRDWSHHYDVDNLATLRKKQDKYIVFIGRIWNLPADISCFSISQIVQVSKKWPRSMWEQHNINKNSIQK